MSWSKVSGQDSETAVPVLSPEQGSHAASTLAWPCQGRHQDLTWKWRHQLPTWWEIARRSGRMSMRERWSGELQQRWKRRGSANQVSLHTHLTRADAHRRALPPLSSRQLTNVIAVVPRSQGACCAPLRESPKRQSSTTTCDWKEKETN